MVESGLRHGGSQWKKKPRDCFTWRADPFLVTEPGSTVYFCCETCFSLQPLSGQERPSLGGGRGSGPVCGAGRPAVGCLGEPPLLARPSLQQNAGDAGLGLAT